MAETKFKRVDRLKPMYCKYIPKIKESGILYISRELKLAIHLCACGCGAETVTPIDQDNNFGWQFIHTHTGMTLKPSIGNFSGENPYHAHYYVTDSKIEWI